MSEWQPAETAPSDHRMMLLHSPTSQRGAVDSAMTDKEIIDWVGGLISAVESQFAVGPHDMDEDNANLEELKKRLADKATAEQP